MTTKAAYEKYVPVRDRDDRFTALSSAALGKDRGASALNTRSISASIALTSTPRLRLFSTGSERQHIH